MITLTKKGLETFTKFIHDCEIERDRLLANNLDTNEETKLPTVEDIISDINVFEDEEGEYCNNWGITDEYNSPYPLCLQRNVDYIEVGENEETRII